MRTLLLGGSAVVLCVGASTPGWARCTAGTVGTTNTVRCTGTTNQETAVDGSSAGDFVFTLGDDGAATLTNSDGNAITGVLTGAAETAARLDTGTALEAGTITGSASGISLSATAGASILIGQGRPGGFNANVTGRDGYGITVATTGTGAVAITTAAGTTVTGTLPGILATVVNGDATLVLDGDVVTTTPASNYDIQVLSSGTGNIKISGTGASLAGGIFATASGTGGIDITGTGPVTDFANGPGINALISNSGSSANIHIARGGAVIGAFDGISAYNAGSGDASVTALSTVQGKHGFGIHVFTASGTSRIDVAAGATVSGSSGAIGSSSSTLNVITNEGVVDGQIVTSGPAQITNTGTINATNGVSIQFGGDPNTLTLGTGSVINGNVIGGDGTDTLVLTGSGSETLDKFQNFETLSMQGTAWTVGGTGVFSSDVTVSAGRLTVTGDITTPTVTIGSGGTLQVGNGAAAGSISGAVTDNGVLAFDRSDTVQVANAITGTGALQQIGTGTLFLTADNSFTGGTLVQSGILQIGDGGTTGSVVGPIVDNAQIVVDRAGIVTFGGAISGTGSITQSGPGQLNLTGNNSYQGGTFLDMGTIGIGSATALGTGPLSLAPGTGLVFLGSYALTVPLILAKTGDPTIDTGANAVTLSGVISGPGSLTKLGSGTLDLTAVNTYTGPTTVAQGTLIVDGSIANSAVTVDAGASLGGNGRIGGLTVASGATVAPGASTPFSTLTVNGNLTFAAGSTYRVGIDDTGRSDHVAVTGTATIAGGTVDVLAGTGNYDAGARYTILTASGGLNGQFSDLTVSSNLAFLTPTLSYDANDVTLGFRQTASFPSVGKTRNQRAVAGAIGSLGAKNPIFGAIIGQSVPGAQQGFSGLSGEAHGNAPTQAIAGLHLVNGIIFDRLWNVAGTGGSDAVSVLDQFGPTTLPTLLRCYTPVTEPGHETQSNYTVWGQGIGAFGRNGSDGNAQTIESTLGGFAFGIDTRLDAKGLDNWRVGVAAGYTNDAFSPKGGGSEGTFENVFGTLYAGARYDALDIRLGATYGGTATNLRRTIAFPGFFETEHSSNGGDTVQGFGEVGYRFAFGQTVVEPVLDGSFTHVHQDGFTEQGGAAALVGFAQDTDVGSTTLGVRGEAMPFGTLPIVARVFLGWQHSYGDVNPAASVAFASGSTRFDTYGTPLDSNSVVAETSIDWRATSALSVGLAYAGQAGHRDRDNAVKGRMEYRF